MQATVLLNLEQLREVIDLMGEDDPAAFDRWIVRLESELAEFKKLLPLVRAEDGPRATSAAHSLKGTCLVMGAQALAERFAELEACSKGGKIAEFNRLATESRELETASLQALREASTQ